MLSVLRLGQTKRPSSRKGQSRFETKRSKTETKGIPMSRTKKHPPAPDRFTSRNRTSGHAKEAKIQDAISLDGGEFFDDIITESV